MSFLSLSEQCDYDNNFGPVVKGCRDDFDFTVTFERIFLAIVPSAIFIPLALIRVFYLWRSSRVVGGNVFQGVKLIAIVVYATTNFALLLFNTTLSPESNFASARSLTTAAFAVTFVSSLVMLPLSYLDHQTRARPSMLLTFYILITILLDIVQVRTIWLLGATFFQLAFARFFTLSFATKFIILLLETLGKNRWLLWDHSDHSPEELEGIIGLATFSWLTKLFFAGYGKVLTDNDLYPLDPKMSANTMHLRFTQVMKSTTNWRNRKYGLLYLLFKTMPGEILFPLLPRLAALGFEFCQPFFLQAMLTYLISADSTPDAPQHGKNKGYGLIGACVIIYVGATLFHGMALYLTQRYMYMIRACLASVIYEKTTETCAEHLENSAPLTLMSTDVERIVRSSAFLHDIWIDTIQCTLGSWLLYEQLGAAFAAPIVTVVIAAILCGVISPLVATRQRSWMEMLQKRVGLTSSVISNMKSSKISGLVDPIERIVKQLRLNDIIAGNRWRAMVLAIAMVSLAPRSLAPVFTFAVAAKELGVTKVYTSMTFLIMLTTPLTALIQVVVPIQAALACCVRIREFLEQDAHIDYRNAGAGIRRVDASSNVLYGAEKHSENIPMTTYPRTDDGPSMSITQGFFGWEKDKMVLKDINIIVPRNALTLIVGPVASGKSTLCKALLGETVYYSGTITADTPGSQIAYCEQVPFLLNATLKENIVGFTQYDQEKYDAVVQATMLSLDVSLLPQGHDTRIGSNGMSLSGGQKQRVSLARALYLGSDIIILDDILSGLDNDTETQVFNRVFGPKGLLCKRGSTTVLCTHSIRHLPAADHIIALTAEGTIAEEGTFSELVKLGNYIASLGLQKHYRKPALLNIAEDEEYVEMTDAQLAEPSGVVMATGVDVIPEDGISRQMGDWKMYKIYFAATGYAYTTAFFGVCILYAFSSNFATTWLGYWTEDRLHLTQSQYLGVFALLHVAELIFSALGFWLCLQKMVRRSGIILHDVILSTVMRAPLRFFTTTDTGTVTNLFSQDLNLLDMELPISLTNTGATLMDTIGIACVVAVATPWLAIAYPFLVVVLWLLQRFYLRTSRQLRILDLEAKSPLYTHFIDTMKGAVTIRAFNWSKENVAYNFKLLHTSQQPAYLLAMVQSWLTIVLDLVVAVIAFLLVTLATQLKVSAGFAGSSFLALLSFGQTLTTMIQTYTLLETSIGAVARIDNFSQRIKPEDKPSENIEPSNNWPSAGQVVLRGVSATYGPKNDELSPNESQASRMSTNKLTLDQLTFTLTPGSKVAICGRSGSGKSSLVLLLLKLLDPISETANNIYIDSIPLHRIDRCTLRRRIIAVPQDAVFLPAGLSIQENIDPFGEASERLCEEVLHQVKMGKWLESKGGVGAPMDGESLSAGQKQLLNLGRAIIRRRMRDSHLGLQSAYRAGGLLLLDEVSSGVDTVTEREMQEIIKEEFANYTVIMISHRLDMVVDFATRVIVMDQGSIIEDGVPRELIQQEHSRFRELWRLGNVWKDRSVLSGVTVI